MNDQEMNILIDKMREVFSTRTELISSNQETREELVSFRQETGDKLGSFRQDVNQRLDGIEKDLKSVVRIYNLDEEMNTVYSRLKHLEQKTGLSTT